MVQICFAFLVFRCVVSGNFIFLWHHPMVWVVVGWFLVAIKKMSHNNNWLAPFSTLKPCYPFSSSYEWELLLHWKLCKWPKQCQKLEYINDLQEKSGKSKTTLGEQQRHHIIEMLMELAINRRKAPRKCNWKFMQDKICKLHFSGQQETGRKTKTMRSKRNRSEID